MFLKTPLLLFLMAISLVIVAQDQEQLENIKANLFQAKTSRDFKANISPLSDYIADNPGDQEALYLRAWTRFRMISEYIYDYDFIFSQAEKITEDLDHCITIDSNYTHPLIVHDPYGLKVSTWGFLLMQSQIRNDSLAINEIMERIKVNNALPQVLLNFGKNMLNTCSGSSLLFTSGDFNTYPILFLQLEGYRPDVRVVSIPMLNNKLYLKNIIKGKHHLLNDILLDSLKNQNPENTQLMIKKGEHSMDWQLNLGNEREFLSVADQVFISLIQQNESGDVFFTKGINPVYLMGLEKHLLSYGILSRLTMSDKPDLTKSVEVMKGYTIEPKSSIERYSQDLSNMKLLYHTAFLKTVLTAIALDQKELGRSIFQYYNNHPELSLSLPEAIKEMKDQVELLLNNE